MNKQDYAIIACLIFIIGSVGFLFFKLHPVSVGQILSWSPAQGETEGVMVKVKQQKRPTTVLVTSAPAANAENDDTLFNRLAADPKSQKITMIDVIGSNTSGIAYFLRENGKLFVTAQANMPDAPEGEYFQAWLMKETPRRYYVPLGKLKHNGIGKFISNTALDSDYADFNTMIITLEKNDDKLPERFVMQGSVQ